MSTIADEQDMDGVPHSADVFSRRWVCGFRQSPWRTVSSMAIIGPRGHDITQILMSNRQPCLVKKRRLSFVNMYLIMHIGIGFEFYLKQLLCHNRLLHSHH